MYCKELTKDYLIELGITNVNRAGVVWVNGKIKFPIYNCGYYKITFYSKDKYLDNKAKGKNLEGTLTIPVHRIVWAWFNDKCRQGYVIDHINDNKLDNNIINLQEITPLQNIMKHKSYTKNTIKCDLSKPRKFYEDKLFDQMYAYEQAKQLKDKKLIHRCRIDIYQTRCKLRFYDENAQKSE